MDHPEYGGQTETALRRREAREEGSSSQEVVSEFRSGKDERTRNEPPTTGSTEAWVPGHLHGWGSTP